MLNNVLFINVYKKRMEKQQRGKFPGLARQLGTPPVHFPAVNGSSPLCCF